MPTKGQILINPASGDSYEFIETAKDTNGERVTMKATIKTRGQLVPDHFHVLQDESFEVISGTLTVKQTDGFSLLSNGKKISLPKNKVHNHYNDTPDELIYIHTVTPALDFDYFIENLVGLAADGKSKNGNYGIVQQLVTLKYMDSKAYLADIPVGVQNLLMALVAPVARLFGYRAIYKKYSGIEK